VERGVSGAPALVLGNRWMICGLRELSDYRTHLLDCLRKHAAARRRASEELLH